MSFFDLQIPFFIPVWRRCVLIGICLVWSAFEFFAGETFWGLLFVGLGALAAWQLFFSGWPEGESPSGE